MTLIFVRLAIDCWLNSLFLKQRL
ncbi:hypothetical protein BVIET440_270005 [Burkholderia vietnamiensis]|nr:hypothetical protein BVI2075_440026 [Burkholderia vietnamiensis]